MYLSNLFYWGGAFNLILLSLVLMGIVIFMIKAFMHQKDNSPAQNTAISFIRQLSLFAFFWSILHQSLDFISMMEAIEAAGNIRPATLADGLRFSFMRNIYGLMIAVVGFGAIVLLSVRSFIWSK